MRNGNESVSSECYHHPRLRRGGSLSLGFLLELVEYVKGLRNLRLEGLVVVDEVEQLAVLHLEQHARDLAREFRLSTNARISQQIKSSR